MKIFLFQNLAVLVRQEKVHFNVFLQEKNAFSYRLKTMRILVMSLMDKLGS